MFPLVPPASNKTTFEFTPITIMLLHAPQVIKRLFPHMKLIVTLRDPAFRDVSAFFHYKRHQGLPEVEVNSYINSMIDKLSTTPSLIMNMNSSWGELRELVPNTAVVGRGLYSPQLKYWLQYFSRSQMFICTLDQLEDPLKAVDVMNNLTKFLNLKPMDWTAVVKKKANASPDNYVTNVTSKVIHRLKEMYRPWNEELMRLLPEFAEIITQWNR
eukprot:TRINITY_DN7466_c0_g1_i1.p1 TRINITY_DN7466_c0_g1~~TRINITY_DN7466_c0_g1_i1.p1  ORF type:complete len:214 (-),score=32.24 TRINITY_DN7466_c0_g1_i1:36-677(-)